MRSPEKLLMVEGTTDRELVLGILKREKLLKKLGFHIEQKNGIDSLINSISAEYKAPGRAVLGILVDADNSQSKVWKRIIEKLRTCTGMNEFPEQPPIGGYVTTGNPRVGIWIMPNNNDRGAVENFIANMIPNTNQKWIKTQRFIDDITASDFEANIRDRMKAQIGVWLAILRQPRSVRTAIEVGNLRVNTELAKRFVGWLKRLGGEEMEFESKGTS